jgi:hypothetical protein
MIQQMMTLFDAVTVTCFVGLVVAFFQFTDRETRTLLQFLLAAVVFAVANQVGNAGWAVLAGVLVIAGTGYAALVVRR